MERGIRITPCRPPWRQACIPGGRAAVQQLLHQQAPVAVQGKKQQLHGSCKACCLTAAGTHLQAPGPACGGAKESRHHHELRGDAGPLTHHHVIHELWQVGDDREGLASRAGGGCQGRYQCCPSWVASSGQPCDQHLQTHPAVSVVGWGWGGVGGSIRLCCSPHEQRGSSSWQCPTSATSGSNWRHAVAHVLAAPISTRPVMLAGGAVLDGRRMGCGGRGIIAAAAQGEAAAPPVAPRRLRCNTAHRLASQRGTRAAV
jgi:hypothetical protein